MLPSLLPLRRKLTMSNLPFPDKVRLLFIEDNQHDALMVHHALSQHKTTYQITHVMRCEDAYQRIKASNERFDCVLTDHKLPGMSGLDFCMQILKEEAKIPMVILTGGGSEATAVTALKAGVSDYLVKDSQGVYLDLIPYVINAAITHHLDHQARLVAENALQTKAYDLQKRNQELDIFSSTVAHDIKSPLTTMMGYAYLLSEADEIRADPDLENYTATILRVGNAVSEIIDSMLLSAHLAADNGQDHLELEPLMMGELIRNVCERLQFSIEESQGEIIIPDADSWPLVIGHRLWVEAIWANYISNALKYGGEPPIIELGVERIDDTWWQFWIQDNGGGVPAEQHDTIFSPYVQEGDHHRGGVGLGLSIVRRITDRLGCVSGIEPSSLSRQGSRFYFTLPDISASESNGRTTPISSN